jgi:hypothetical protein
MKKKKQSGGSFSQRLVNLISEPDFIRFENALDEPNIFKIVGRTHYERWHSCFWGWLLDPNGTHLLNHYILVKLLILISDEKALQPKHNKAHLIYDLLPTIDFTEIQVAPNEFVSSETSVAGLGRFDIFLTAKFVEKLGTTRTLNIIFELKVDAPADHEQSKKYPDWMEQTHPDDINLLIYLTPSLKKTSEETVGDSRWHCLNYQLLNDKLLTPLLDHPNLNEKVRPFIIQYIKNLKIRHKGVKMAITEEEKRLAVALYDKYSDVFDSIYDALHSTGTIEYSTSELAQHTVRASGRIAVKINKKVFSDEMVRTLFKQVLSYLVDKKIISRLPLPWGSTNKRYILSNAKDPIHPNGRPFFAPEKYEGYSIETHYSRERAMQVLNDLCGKLDLEFEQIDV